MKIFPQHLGEWLICVGLGMIIYGSVQKIEERLKIPDPPMPTLAILSGTSNNVLQGAPAMNYGPGLESWIQHGGTLIVAPDGSYMNCFGINPCSQRNDSGTTTWCYSSGGSTK